ncbi:MAG: 3-oxoacyl-ACP synthase III [Desulfurivibrionaceae bacterium]|nr:3-oxoacyl-ACP synthase III [Desulfobulbales bacterium]MDT8334190.1 3-oxoacyl-ACP synthase III [Desulfurivibrionaceae bacterium]
MKFTRVHLHGFGYELPPRVVTSARLEERLATLYERLKLPPGRLEMMSGIGERRFWNEGARPSDGAVLAGRKAIAAAGIDPAELECLFFTGVSRDMMEPATATFVHRQLGLPEKCLVYDISNACLGFLNGMVTLGGMIELGQIKNGLIVSGETAEELVESTIVNLLNDPTVTRKSIKNSFASLTIGSGAVALVMGDAGGRTSAHKLINATYRAKTSFNDLCQGGQVSASGTLMATDSEELLKRGVETAAETWRDFLTESGWSADSVARFFCHQVGSAHARLLFETLGLDQTRNYETLARLGNVGSVSAPITLAMGIEAGMLKDGGRAAVLGIGSGINCLMLGIEW